MRTARGAFGEEELRKEDEEEGGEGKADGGGGEGVGEAGMVGGRGDGGAASEELVYLLWPRKASFGESPSEE